MRPRLVVYGHIHEARGLSFDGTTLFVNAASFPPGGCAEPIVVDVPLDKRELAAVVPPSCWALQQ